ncbi:MAG: PP2C family protein-serine/threonine phosphatase, partial [bacterium]
DIVLVYLLMISYARLETPGVALKNYAFFLIFPIIALTAFRYNQRLTWLTGGLAFLLYVGMFLYLCLSGAIKVTAGDYTTELFSKDITFAGQFSKAATLLCFVALMTYLARYTRNLFDKMVMQEVNLRIEKESIERELQIAAQVQQELLPQSLPKVPCVEIHGTLLQGRFVGGDYYDFLPLSETSLLVVVADVSGKGVPAALIMSEVRASTHLLASMQMTLEELVQRLNALLFKSIERKYFVSFFAAEIDTKQKMMYYVNAGHPPPLVCLHGRISALVQGSLALGVRASLPQLTKQSEPFPRGGMLVAFTDGICERTNGRGEQFGDNRLEKFVQRHAELNAPLFVVKLLDEVKSFGQGKDLDDDVAIAVAKFCTEGG